MPEDVFVLAALALLSCRIPKARDMRCSLSAPNGSTAQSPVGVSYSVGANNPPTSWAMSSIVSRTAARNPLGRLMKPIPLFNFMPEYSKDGGWLSTFRRWKTPPGLCVCASQIRLGKPEWTSARSGQLSYGLSPSLTTLQYRSLNPSIGASLSGTGTIECQATYCADRRLFRKVTYFASGISGCWTINR